MRSPLFTPSGRLLLDFTMAPALFHADARYLDFEKPVAELEAKVEELRALTRTGAAVVRSAMRSAASSRKAGDTLAELYTNLTPWQKTQVARHPQRPRTASTSSQAFSPNSCRSPATAQFGDDNAIIGGFGRFNGDSICLIGHEKGSTTEARLKHNFGVARPEGYRKAVRLMEMADRFGIPVISLVDTGRRLSWH